MRGFPISCGFVLVQPRGLDLFYGRMHAIISLEYPNMKLIKALSAAAVLGLAVAPAANAQVIIAGTTGAGGAGAAGAAAAGAGGAGAAGAAAAGAAGAGAAGAAAAVGLGGLTAGLTGLVVVGATAVVTVGLSAQEGGAAPSTN